MSKGSGRVTRYLAEFAVIFLGVSLSFVAEDYRETRGDRSDERESISLIINTLEASSYDLHRRQTDRSLAAIRRLLNSRDQATPSAETVAAWLNDAAWCTPVVQNNDDYEALKSSGQLGLIQDDGFRTDVSSHFERYGSLYDLSVLDCDQSFMLPVAEHVRSDAGEEIPLYPTYEVTGSVEAILGNREFMMRLAHTHWTKGLIRLRIDVMARQRDELLAEARALLASW